MQRRGLAICLCLLLITNVACSRAATPTPRPTDSPASGASLITQAVGILLDRYVDPLSSADLYTAAYDTAAAEARKAGREPAGQRPAFTGDQKKDADAFRQAYQALAEPAGAGAAQTALAYGAIRGVTERIDECHTNFLDPEQYQQTTARLSGTANYAGIGVTTRTGVSPVVIGGVFPNTPAERAGLRAGDAIVAVDGTDVSTLTAEQVTPLVRGKEGTPVRLTIQRPGEPAPRDITITREVINLPVFTSEVRDGPGGTKIGYMKLYSFSTGAENNIRAALEEFERQGVTGWVFDLRDNGGGYVNTLSAIAGHFLKEGNPIAYTIERGGKEETIAVERDRYFTPQRPFAVLIDEGSASASEAFAAAAQDYGFARLFGQTTAGCLAAAVTQPLADGSAVGVTIEKVLSPKKREINRIGVQPDEAVAPDPSGASDPVLDAAARWLASQR